MRGCINRETQSHLQTEDGAGAPGVGIDVDNWDDASISADFTGAVPFKSPPDYSGYGYTFTFGPLTDTGNGSKANDSGPPADAAAAAAQSQNVTQAATSDSDGLDEIVVSSARISLPDLQPLTFYNHFLDGSGTTVVLTPSQFHQVASRGHVVKH